MFSAGEELSRALEVVEDRRRVKRRGSSRRKRSTAGGGGDDLNESTAEATFKEDGSSSSSPILRLQFTAFSSPFHLRLWPNHKLLSPAFQMINEINGGRQSPFKTKSKGGDPTSKVMDSLAALEDCFYQGVVEGQPGSAVALSLCNGMQGVIETKEGGVYVVSPLPGHTVERFLQGANGTNSSSSSSSSSSYHIILRKNGDEFNDYQCPHRQPSKAHSAKKSHSPRSPRFDLVRLSPLNQTTTTTTTTTATTKVAGKRSKRSIDVVASDLNFLDETEGQQQQQKGQHQQQHHQQQQHSPQHPTAPIQLDDIGSNDVYDDTSSSSNSSSSSSSSLYNSPPPPPPSPLSPSTDASNTFNITVETAVFVDESLYHLLSKTFPVDTEQQIVLYVLTIMNAVQLLFKQPSIGRSVEISVVLMDLLKQQPKVSALFPFPFFFLSFANERGFDGLVLDLGSITRARALTLMECARGAAAAAAAARSAVLPFAYWLTYCTLALRHTVSVFIRSFRRE